RRQDVIGAVKGWVLPLAKPTDVAPAPPEKHKPTSPEDTASIPSIPSPSPSPPITSRVANPDRQNKPIPQPSAPAQPTPILHQSLSRARRPGILIADEAGVPPPDDVMPRPKDRTFEWVEAISTRAGFPGFSSHDRSRPLQSTQVAAPNPMPADRKSGRHQAPQPMRGPRRPQKLVMPTPLSPARYPPGNTTAFQPISSGDYSYGNPAQLKPIMTVPPPLPPGAGYGPASNMRVPNSYGAPLSHVPTMPPSAVQPKFNPYENTVPLDPPISIPTERRPRQSRGSRRRDQGVESPPVSGANPRKSRSNSPFGIEAASSDNESLPRHPALRQHTKRQRRRSQPLPEIPASERVADKVPLAEHGFTTKTESEPFQGQMSSSPAAMPLSLSSPSLLSPALTTNGDTRYPQGTSRSNYFDSYDTVAPYLTNIMDDGPSSPSQSLPVASSSAKAATTRRTIRR
ncbi:hypothetical protein FRC17_006980, partial [Serendipita sp. 399]